VRRQSDGATNTYTLTWHTGDIWRDAGFNGVFTCSGGPQLIMFGNPDIEVYHAGDTTCSPFHFHFTCNATDWAGCPCPPGTCYDFYVDG
jgi:hypothetical protein